MIEKSCNQKVLKVIKEVANSENKYAVFNLNAADNAALRLHSLAGFKLWFYIAKNQNNYEFALSSKHFMKWSGYERKAYTSAVKELIDKGFLMQCKKKDYYIFYEFPKEHKWEVYEENDFCLEE